MVIPHFVQKLMCFVNFTPSTQRLYEDAVSDDIWRDAHLFHFSEERVNSTEVAVIPKNIQKHIEGYKSERNALVMAEWKRSHALFALPDLQRALMDLVNCTTLKVGDMSGKDFSVCEGLWLFAEQDRGRRENENK
ncbi:hypothetical protein SUGI_1146050 [Cryptomeria japonica]|nr:hypothetical protein SUGI_1146050 [Cryptomeria japonica]